ncbi:MAG TPA: terminase family protein [Allosphingosinicella sp.]|jgi:phage terminase large subunit-like protein
MLRGPEHHIAWCDELAKWEEAQASWDMLQFGLRLGDWPRAIVTTTPRPGPVLTAIMEDPETVVTGGPTSRNPHTSPAWRKGAYARYSGTRLGRQELEGEVLPDVPGALWSIELLERCRAKPSPSRGEGRLAEGERGEGESGAPRSPTPPLPSAAAPLPPSPRRGEGTFRSPHESPTFIRVLIGVDPPSGDGTCGIIACAKDAAGNAHVLADHSVTARTPEGWARAVADAAQIWGQVCNTVPVAVAESNQGGEMIRAVFRTADPNLKVKLVRARHGKSERASPIAMLFEAGKVVLHGRFPELEAQLCGMIAGGDYQGPGNSPDRADAMVWGLTELMLARERAIPSVRSL